MTTAEARGVRAVIAAMTLAPHPPAAIPPADATPEIPAALLTSVLRGAGQSDLPPVEQIARTPEVVRTWPRRLAQDVAAAQQ